MECHNQFALDLTRNVQFKKKPQMFGNDILRVFYAAYTSTEHEGHQEIFKGRQNSQLSRPAGL